MSVTKKYVSLEKLGLYDEKIKAKIASDDAKVLADAKAHAEGLATNYDTAGAAATVQAELDKEVARAKAREDEIAGLVATAQDEVDALETVVAGKAAQTDLDALAGKVGEVPEDQTVMGIIANIQENAYDDTELKAEINAELAKKADKTQVATDIETAVNAEKSARETAVAGVQGAVDALSGTHATDKKALEDAIALKASKEELNAVSDVANAAVKQADYDVKVKALEDEDARIVGLVTSEAELARAAEKANADAIATIKEDVDAFFKDADMTESAKDTLKELQTYIASDETAASEMAASIQQNKKAIEDHVATDHDFASADAALKAELEGKIGAKADSTVVEGISGKVTTLEGEMDAVEGKVTTLEGQMTAVQGAVATKVEQEAYNAKVTELEDADEAQVERISALEAKFADGDGSVEDMISDAVEAEATRVDGELAKKVDKVDGKGLSTNDLTNELKAQYDAAYTHSQTAHAPADAQANVIESIKVNGSAVTITDKAVDITVPTDNAQLANGAGYLVANDVANKADKATTLGGYGITDAYTSAQTDTAIANAVGQFVEASEEEINAMFPTA